MSGLNNMIGKGHNNDLQNLKVSRLEFVNTWNQWEMTSDKLGKCFKDNDFLTYGKQSKIGGLMRKHWVRSIRTHVLEIL